MNRWLILFAKEPKKNQVKTRLRPYLPTGSAEGIYMAFLPQSASCYYNWNRHTDITS